LLEVMISVCILGIALVVIMQLFSLGLKSSAVDREYSRAIVLARMKMGEIMLQPDIEEGSDSGSFDDESEFGQDYTWSLDVTPFEPPVSEQNKSPLADKPSGMETNEEDPYKMYELMLKVHWNSSGERSKNVTLHTLRLVQEETDMVPPAPAAPQEPVDEP